MHVMYNNLMYESDKSQQCALTTRAAAQHMWSSQEQESERNPTSSCRRGAITIRKILGDFPRDLLIWEVYQMLFRYRKL